MYLTIWSLVAFVGVTMATPTEQQFCLNLNAQNSLDVGQIMGMWYGIELIPHIREDEGVRLHESCPIIHLSDITFERTTTVSNLMPGDYGYQWSRGYGPLDFKEHEYRYLRLYWDEGGNGLEYTLKYNTSRRGFWVSGTPKYGEGGTNVDAIDWIASYLSENRQQEKSNSARWRSYRTGVPQAGGYGYGDVQYMNDRTGRRQDRQQFTFAGVIQVIKAVSNQLVLTFCQRMPESQLFTIILAREPNQLTMTELHSVHNLLNRRDLSTSAIKKVCNGTAVLTVHFFTYFLSCFIAYFALGTRL